MSIVKYISNEGAEHTVDDSSVAAEIMRGDPKFILVSIDGKKMPISAIEPRSSEKQEVAENASVAPINAAMIRELMSVRETKVWKDLGFNSFGDFLNSDGVPDFNKTKFYKLRSLLLAEGDDRFDVLVVGYKTRGEGGSTN
jgi:hypothetical protein